MPVIQAVQIERASVFGAGEGAFFATLANGLHVTTRESVIRRELLLGPGDPYDSASVAETARNLRRLGVFRFVEIDTVRSDSGLVLRVRTGDGWSTKVGFSFRSTSGQTGFTASLVEENLLGTANRASLSLRKDPDRTGIITVLRAPRLIAGRVSTSAQYVQFANASDGRILWGQVAQPYYSLSTRTAWSVTAEDRRQRVLRFFEGEDVASDTAQRRMSSISAAWGLALRADPRGYVRLGLGAAWRREDFGTEAQAAARQIPSSHFGDFGAAIEWRKARFVISRSFRGLAREEDIDISTTFRIGAWVTPKVLGYEEDGIVPGVAFRTGFQLPGGFAYLDASAYRRISSAAVDTGSVNTALTMFLQPYRRHAAILYAGAGWQYGASPGAEYDLGFDLGPRGYPAHAFTGNRAFFGTAEYRFTLAEDFLRLMGVGLAAFVDYGGAWYAGSPKRTGWDAGIGLRLGASRSTELEVNRFDLVHCFGGAESLCGNPGGFSLVIAKGFPFSTNGRLFR